MFRFWRPETIVAFLLGVALFAVWETVLDYQAANCSYQKEYQRNPEPHIGERTSGDQKNDGDEQKEHSSIREPFVCGIAGTPTALRTLMNHNEGFFVGGFTFMLVFVTAWLVWATLKLWEAADETAKTQERDTKILQRAYLSVEPLGIYPFVRGNYLSCTVGIKNSGNLPAREVSWNIRRNFSRDDDRRDFPISESKFIGNNIIPQNVITPKGARGIPMQSLARYGNGASSSDRWLYVWGEVRYLDGFGKRRFTRFCHRYNLAALDVSSLTIDPRHARYHEHGNHTDEEQI